MRPSHNFLLQHETKVSLQSDSSTVMLKYKLGSLRVTHKKHYRYNIKTLFYLLIIKLLHSFLSISIFGRRSPYVMSLLIVSHLLLLQTFGTIRKRLPLPLFYLFCRSSRKFRQHLSDQPRRERRMAGEGGCNSGCYCNINTSSSSPLCLLEGTLARWLRPPTDPELMRMEGSEKRDPTIQIESSQHLTSLRSPFSGQFLPGRAC